MRLLLILSAFAALGCADHEAAPPDGGARTVFHNIGGGFSSAQLDVYRLHDDQLGATCYVAMYYRRWLGISCLRDAPVADGGAR